MRRKKAPRDGRESRFPAKQSAVSGRREGKGQVLFIKSSQAHGWEWFRGRADGRRFQSEHVDARCSHFSRFVAVAPRAEICFVAERALSP